GVVGPPVRVGGHELPVDHAAARDACGRRRHLRQVGRQVVEAAVLQVNFAFGIAEQHAPEPIPLDLEQVLRGAERSLGRSRLHGAHLGGEALELDLELVRVHGSRLALVRYEALRRAFFGSGAAFARAARDFLAASTDALKASMRSMTLAVCGTAGASMTSPSILAWTTLITASRYSSLYRLWSNESARLSMRALAISSSLGLIL